MGTDILFLVYADLNMADSFTDSVLMWMRYDLQLKEELDPLKVPKFGEGNYEVTNGRVFGLLSFTRNGNSSLFYSSDAT